MTANFYPGQPAGEYISKLNEIATYGFMSAEDKVNFERLTKRLGEIVIVSDYSTVQEAVTYAYTNSLPLYWPGLYTVVSNIAHFHDVKHIGPGGIIRGTDTFYIEPSDAQINTVYFSASGSDANDGLTADHPIQTLSKLKAALINTTANQRGGTWVMKFAEGTYSDSTNFTDLPFFRNAIRFIGTGTSRNPQTIFNGETAAYKTAGMYFQNRTNVFLQYLKFANFTSGYGVLAEKNCQIELTDCTADACLIGFAAGYSSYIRTTRCLANACTGSGFRVASNGQASFVPSTGLFADSNRAIGCGCGFTVTRNSYAHVDFNEIEDCTVGILVEINSRAAALANNFKRNAVAVRLWTSGYMSVNEPAQTNVYNQGTTDANTEVYEFRGSSGIVGLHGQAGTVGSSIVKFTTKTTVTGTAAATQIGGTLFTAWAGWFVDDTKRIKVRVWGTVTTPVDGTIVIQPRLHTSTLSALTVPSGITGQPFVFESETIATGSATQKTINHLTYGGGSVVMNVWTTTVDCASGARELTFFTDANGAGAASASITIESIEVVICG